MSGFSAQWLALREPYDARARNPAVLDAVVAAMSGLPSISVVDLACGTGATLRALEPHLPARQVWKLVDNNLGLLARAADTPRMERTTVTATPVDLAVDLEVALDGAVDLVTTSALLDLVSASWLERLATEVAVRRLPFYEALTYDGRVEFEPSDPQDRSVIDAVNKHQRNDKGFGPALGPTAVTAATAAFERLGYEVTRGPSDWTFGPEDQEIQMDILVGWATAAREMGALGLDDLAAWLRRRQESVAARRSQIRVGHVDLFAQPKRG